MPWFALIGYDAARGAELRRLHRPGHLEHWKPLDAAGRVRFGGPLLDEAGSPRGSLLLFEAAHLEAARAHAARDPYVTAGLFERHDLLETRAVFPGTSGRTQEDT